MKDALAFTAIVAAPNLISFALVTLFGGGSACPRSSLQPPGYVFAVAWSILYLLLGFSMALLHRHQHYHALANLAALLFGLNAWWVLFGPRCRPVPALVSILALLAGCVVVTLDTFRVHELAAGLLIPLALWLSFASLLSMQQVHNL